VLPAGANTKQRDIFSRKGAKQQRSKDYITTLPYSYYAIFALCGLKIRFGLFATLLLCGKKYRF
jgi:hypothetical protein